MQPAHGVGIDQRCRLERAGIQHDVDLTSSSLRRRFELLKRAYVEARYSDQYDASAEDLDWLMSRARHLRDLVADLCQTRIAELKAKAETA